MVGALMTEEASNKDKVMQRRLMITVERKEIENTRRHDARYMTVPALGYRKHTSMVEAPLDNYSFSRSPLSRTSAPECHCFVMIFIPNVLT
jgi:hypothetical protein